MKLNKILLASAFACMGLASCDFTDIAPIDSFTDESYWNTTNDLKLYANGLYGFLAAPTSTGDNVSDNFVTNAYSTLLYDEINVNGQSGNWSFTDIRNVNYFLSRYQKAQGTEAEINKYVAEVRFFRSLIYFNKIKEFGDFPWYDHDLKTTDTEELYKARDNEYMVLSKVLEDLDYAIQWLPEASAAEKGRLHKDAARAQAARVCLYYGTYMKYHNVNSTYFTSKALLEKARDYSQAVIATGNYDIVQGSDAGAETKSQDGYPLHYANQFVQKDLDGNKEAILARYYVAGTLAHEVGRQVGQNGMGFSKAFVESFLMKDGTPIYNAGSGYKGDATLEDELADRDPRMYNVIENPHKSYILQSDGSISVLAPSNHVVGSQGCTGYPNVKFHSANSKQAEARNTDYDWFVYRYAEVLLINAEAHAELGSCTQAVLDKTINLLRDRVEMAHLTTTPVADAAALDYGYDLSNLLREIRRERNIELIAEGFRLDDIKRWNATKLFANPLTVLGLKITDWAKAEYGDFEGRTAEYNGATYLYNYAASKQLGDPKRVWGANDRRWHSPVPTNQLTLNPNLVQTPGW